MILKLLGWQGIAGIAGMLLLVILLGIQKAETHHWKKQSAGFEQLYHQDQAAFATTVANYRTAAVTAAAADAANTRRVTAEQAAINKERGNEFEARTADADARYQRLRAAASATHPGPGGNASVPGAGADRPALAGAAGQNGLSLDDRHIATRQSIQLDELIKAVKQLQAVDVNGIQSPHQ